MSLPAAFEPPGVVVYFVSDFVHFQKSELPGLGYSPAAVESPGVVACSVLNFVHC